VILFVIYNFGAAFLDATIDSVSIQQARADIEMGQKIMSSYRSTFLAIGMMCGSAVVILFKNPFKAFQIGGTMGLIITVAGFFLSNENETNKYAQQAIELE
jgi:uncharacterized membrane protein YjjP (DUF1212 family)